MLATLSTALGLELNDLKGPFQLKHFYDSVIFQMARFLKKHELFQLVVLKTDYIEKTGET